MIHPNNIAAVGKIADDEAIIVKGGADRMKRPSLAKVQLPAHRAKVHHPCANQSD
jgi:hypothetical protein